MDVHPKTAISKGSYRLGWEYLNKLIAAYWPALKIRHPWPDARLVVKRDLREEPDALARPSGSVRAPRGYRDAPNMNTMT